MKWAFKTLKRYRERFCMFNDDVQGTAGVALAGLLGTVRAQGRSLDDFPNHKIVVVGSGSAGLGVLSMAVQAVVRMTGNADIAAQNFFLLDKDVQFSAFFHINAVKVSGVVNSGAFCDAFTITLKNIIIIIRKPICKLVQTNLATYSTSLSCTNLSTHSHCTK
uniref:Malic enzyme NAD-binding domain-containing protein n=1 Tax=Gossypium raimondii TaxID=29730 RepID=A0A0D2RQ21_GOSRA|nr:hypothetical protein B456_011G197700 [Gossypium raimondii]